MAEELGPKSLKQEMYINSTADVTVFGGAAGSGKALRFDSPVLTPNGWIAINNLEVGDEIVGPKNNIEKVTGVFPQGIVQLYRVTFQDGAFVDTCAEHLWAIHRARDGNKRKKRIVSTRQLEIILQEESIKPNSNHRWPLVDVTIPVPVSPPDQELPLHPYVLGALIGDGGMTGSATILTSADPELAEYVVSLGYNLNKMPSSEYGYGFSGIKQITSDLGIRVLSQNKSIPKQYLEASIEDRFELIRGLMDTDGTVGKNKNISYSTTSPVLAKQVQYLIRSLGGTCTICNKSPQFTNKFGDKQKGLPAYELYIRHPNGELLFHLKRKKDRTKPKDIKNRVKSIEKIDSDFAVCISITGEDKQFITKDFIVTHNTHLGVMDFGKHISYPYFRGIITRRTTPQLKGPGGILDKALKMYKQLDPRVRWKDKDGKFVFTSGAEIYLKHFESWSSHENYQGAEVNEIYVDEGTQYEEDMVIYMMSRLRNPTCPQVKPHMKLSCNPDADSFLRKWVEWYLYPVGHPLAGRPDPLKDGVIRWFIRRDNTMIWADTKEELVKKYPKSLPLSFTFISANVFDNPVMMEVNPEYVGWLEGLKEIEKERLLHGNWFARQSTSGYWKRDWCDVIPLRPTAVVKRVRAWDISGTVPSDANPNPDYTCGVLISKDKNNFYYVEDVVRDRQRHGGVWEMILKTAQHDGQDVDIIIPRDPNASGLAYASQLVRDLAEEGFSARMKIANTSKVTRFAPFASCSEAGGVKIVRGDWNDAYMNELEAFDGGRKGHDDMVDASADAFSALAKSIQIPTFELPDLSRANPFAIQTNTN